MSKFETINAAMVMMDQRPKHRGKIAMATFAITAALVVGQELALGDGTRLHVELSSPPLVHAVMRRDDTAISVIALCGSEREAEERMAVEERAEGGRALQ